MKRMLLAILASLAILPAAGCCALFEVGSIAEDEFRDHQRRERRRDKERQKESPPGKIVVYEPSNG